MIRLPHLPSSDMSLGGRAFIQSILTLNDHTEPVLGGYRGPRVCGGL